jgi:cytochrome d ubiquinol oxidase subunit II
MAELGIDLPLLWAAIIVVGVVMYVLLDGFDLGVGILFPFLPTDQDRDLAMSSVAPIWDGNETWLVLGGAGLFAAFPLAYAVILPGTYLPLLIMLLGLIFRGVAFEFRFKAQKSRHWWDKAFHYGSLAATVAQGVVLGAFIQGFRVEDRQFVGGMLDWLTPFSLMTGAALISGYALLGATWLIMTAATGWPAACCSRCFCSSASSASGRRCSTRRSPSAGSAGRTSHFFHLYPS